EGLSRYRAMPQVRFAEPNHRIKLYAVADDPKLGTLWGLQRIGAFEAWQDTTGSSNIVVGIVDTGINYLHPDLAANVWSNPDEIPGNGIDDDGNGYIDDIHGIDVVDGDSDPMDDDGHGSHVSGTIGAVGNNGLGVVGVNWQVRMVGL